jgi:hypothetical protein
MQNKILQLESKIDPKALYSKSVAAKPKTKLYSLTRSILICGLILVSIGLSSLVVGLNFLEINNPNFDMQGFGKSNGATEQTLSIADILDSNPSIPTQKQFPSDKPYLLLILQGFVAVIAEITSLVLSYSLEFVLIGVFLLITCYWVYRITDWPLTNDKPLLITIILVSTVIIGLGFLTIFNQDRRIPRAIRESRDFVRDKFNFDQGN